MTAEPLCRELLAECRDDPSAFASKLLDMRPTPQQREFLDALGGGNARLAIRSGHGTGKSTALAMAGLWFLCMKRDALVPCTAPTAHQLQDILWREIRRLAARMSPWLREQIRITGARVTIDGSSGMIVARTARAEQPDALQGFHAKNLLFVIDEAAGVPDAVFAAARGALSTPGAMTAMAGNPTRLSGYFHSAFHGARDGWRRFVFSCLDSPLVAESYGRDMADEYGQDSDMYRVRVLGEFPRSGVNAMIPRDRAELAMARPATEGEIRHAPAVLGIDPAWMGSDRSAIALRRGTFAEILFSGRRVDGVRLATLASGFEDRFRADAVFVDQTGVGASVLDQLRNIGRTPVPVAFGGAPLDQGRFVNRRAEMWWLMREWFGGDVSVKAGRDLLDDLSGPEYVMNPRGKIQLESKEDCRRRGIASPDLADALALTFAAPVRKRGRRRAGKIAAGHAHFDWMRRRK